MPVDPVVLKLLYIIAAAVVAGLVTFIVKLALEGVKRKNADGEIQRVIKCPMDKADVTGKINWLHDAHKKTDTDGRLMWYFPPSLEKKFDLMIKHLSNIERAVNGKD